MKGISKLKDDARKLEQREEWDRAIKVYLEVLAAADEAGSGEAELPLYNRVGDLYVRVGRQHDAVRYYEQAADRYAEAGLYNNAIALCNKALRYVPGRLDVLRRLGQYSASQGFLTDARSYYVEYAEKAFASGDTEAALGALRDYAKVSGDADIRELLGRKLHAHGRTQEGIAELKRAYALRLGVGETEAAGGVRREILALDPTAFDGEQGEEQIPLPPPPPILPLRVAELPDLADEPSPPPEPAIPPVAASFAADLAPSGIDELEPEAGPTPALLEGFETTVLEGNAVAEAPAETLSGLEPARAFESSAVQLPRLEGLEQPPDAALEVDSEVSGLELPEEASAGDLGSDQDLAAIPDLDQPPVEEPEPLPLLDDYSPPQPPGEGPPESLPELESLEELTAAAPLPELPELESAGDELAVPELEDLALPADELPLPELGELESPEDTTPLPGLPELDATEDTTMLPVLDAEEPVEDTTPLPVLDAEEPVEDTTPLPLLSDDEVLPPGRYVDLRSLVLEPAPASGDTRFTLSEQHPTGDEDDDFAELLSQFKRKVAENVAPEDAAAHYDLGLAFKEMGLLDEAIGELQVALHAGDIRLKVFEELGLCFLMKHEFSIAEKVLRRALESRYDDELELIGVYYHLGRAYEELRKPDMARDAYERVLSLDINFRDVTDRIARL